MNIWCTKRGHRLDQAYGHHQDVGVCVAGCALRDRCASYLELNPDDIRQADGRMIASGRNVGLPLLGASCANWKLL